MMEPELVDIKGRKIAGITCRTNNLLEMTGGDDGRRIGRLWQQFFEEQVMTQIPHHKEASPYYGVYYDFVSNEHDDYTLLAGIEIDSEATAEAIEPFKLVEVPAGRYLHFSAQGEMPNAVVELWMSIWDYFQAADCPYQRQFGSDFECYPAADRVDIYISVIEES